MDRLDLAILRELFVGRIARFGGIDPRVSAPEVARALNLSHTTVDNRIRAWRGDGFLLGYAAFPNPTLLGLRFFSQSIRHRAARDRSKVMERIAHVPGLFMAWEVDPGFLELLYLGRGPEVAARGAQLIARLAPIRVEVESVPFVMPPTDLALTRSDWRIVQAARAAPTEPWRSIAASAHVSARTLRRRFDRLIDGHALFYTPRWDHTKTPGVFTSFDVNLHRDADVPSVWATIQRLAPSLLPLAPWFGTENVWDHIPERPDLNYFVSFFEVIDGTAGAVRLARALEEIPGVRSVDVTYPYRLWTYNAPFDEAIAAQLEGARPSAPGAPGREASRGRRASHPAAARARRPAIGPRAG